MGWVARGIQGAAISSRRRDLEEGYGFCRGGVGCGWKGISIALTMGSTIAFAIRSVDRSLDRTYRVWVGLRVSAIYLTITETLKNRQNSRKRFRAR